MLDKNMTLEQVKTECVSRPVCMGCPLEVGLGHCFFDKAPFMWAFDDDTDISAEVAHHTGRQVSGLMEE